MSDWKVDDVSIHQDRECRRQSRPGGKREFILAHRVFELPVECSREQVSPGLGKKRHQMEIRCQHPGGTYGKVLGLQEGKGSGGTMEMQRQWRRRREQEG